MPGFANLYTWRFFDRSRFRGRYETIWRVYAAGNAVRAR